MSVGSYGRGGQAETQEPAAREDARYKNTSVGVKRGQDGKGGATFTTAGSSAPGTSQDPALHTQQGETAQPAPLQPAAGGTSLGQGE